MKMLHTVLNIQIVVNNRVRLIGTMYLNSSFSTYCITIFSRSSPKDPMGTLVKEHT